MKYFPVLVLLLLFTLPAFSQQRWERNYGGVDEDYGRSVKQTSDGGYIVAGYTGYRNYYQVYLIKTNASGDTLWTKTYGGSGDDEDYSVQQTSDSGYIVAGLTNSFGNGYQAYLIKTNALGDTLWSRTYGGVGDDEGYSVQQTQDGGYIVAGTTYSFGNGSQVYLIKTNALGDTLWTRTYGGVGSDYGYSVQQTSDLGFIIAGSTGSFPRFQVYLIKTNASGDTLWTRTFGGASWDEGYSVKQTSDGGYIVAGWTNSFGNGEQVYLVKTNASGDSLWTKNIGWTGQEGGHSVQQTSDGGYIVAGYSTTSADTYQVYLVKTNPQGDTLWTRNYGGASGEVGSSVQQTSDGGYIVAGETGSFGYLVQVYLIKTDANGSSGVEVNKGFEGPRVQGFKITPNPFTSFATIPGHEAERFTLYDIAGRKVGTFKGDRIGEGLAPGVYFVRGVGAQHTAPLRIVKVR